MNRPSPKQAGIIVCFIGLLVWVAFALPLGTDKWPAIQLDRAPETLELQNQQVVRQEVLMKEGTFSKVVIFSDNQTSRGQVLVASIFSTDNKLLARGTFLETSYLSATDVLRIEIPLQQFTVTNKESVIVQIAKDGGPPLSIHVSETDEDIYKFGTMMLNGELIPRDMAVSFVEKAPLPFGMRQGVLAGAIFALGLLSISYIPKEKQRWWAVGALLVCITPLALAGYWFSNDKLGIADWDYYFSLHQNYRDIVLKYGQFPFWNPYTCGGTAGLGDPEFPFFTGTFLLELLFGIPIGVRLAIFESVAVTALGMLWLAKRLTMSWLSGALVALGAAFSTVSLLEITEGHVNVFAAMWIPWILAAWLGVYREDRDLPRNFLEWYLLLKPTKKTLLLSLFLALTFYAGGIYLLMYTILAFIALPFLAKNFWRAIAVPITAGIWALGFSALKLFPVLLWLNQFPDQAYQGSTDTLFYISDIFFGRHLHGEYIILNQASGWHEYGAYIGYVLFGLAIVGLSYVKQKRIVRSLFIAAVVVTLLSATGPLLKPLFDLMWFFPRSNISRIILFAVIPIALLAGYGLDRIYKSSKYGFVVAVCLIGIVAIDLLSMTFPLSQQSFVLPDVYSKIEPAPSPIAFITDRYDDNGQGTRDTRTYAATLKGYGTFAYCSVLGPSPMVRTIYDEGDNGMLAMANKEATYSVAEWTPNRVVFRVNTPEDTLITLNTNFADGWTINGNPTQGVDGRVGGKIPAGDQEVVFEFHSPGFRFGLTVIIATLLLLAGLYKKGFLNKRR